MPELTTPEAKQGHRPLYEIAREIKRDWGAKMYFGAKPYVAAMSSLDQVTDDYGCDSGQSIVLYFLANANHWRGETARRVKEELKNIAKYRR